MFLRIIISAHDRTKRDNDAFVTYTIDSTTCRSETDAPSGMNETRSNHNTHTTDDTIDENHNTHTTDNTIDAIATDVFERIEMNTLTDAIETKLEHATTSMPGNHNSLPLSTVVHVAGTDLDNQQDVNDDEPIDEEEWEREQQDRAQHRQHTVTDVRVRVEAREANNDNNTNHATSINQSVVPHLTSDMQQHTSTTKVATNSNIKSGIVNPLVSPFPKLTNAGRKEQMLNGKKRLRFMLGRQKKNFDPRFLSCTFCSQTGHTLECCTKRGRDEATATGMTREQAAYAERLIRAERVDVNKYENMSLEAAAHKVRALGEMFNAGNPWLGSKEPRDQLRANAGYWKAKGATGEVLSWIIYGIEMRFVTKPPRYKFDNNRSYYEHIEHIDAEHERHLKTGSWREVDESFIESVCPLQVELNSRGKKRMCTDVRYPNSFLPNIPFHLETLHDLKDILDNGDEMFSTDMEQAYYSMAMHPSAWPYLCWKHRGKYYCSTVLTFGKSQAPLFFHKTMRVIVRFCRALRIKVLNYLDDFLWAAKRGASRQLVSFVRFLLPALGWRFNDKCKFEPTTSIEFLGMIIDTARFMAFAPDDKVQRIKSAVTLLLTMVSTKTQFKTMELQILTGLLGSVSLAVNPVRVWTREMYRHITRAIERGFVYISPRKTDTTALTEELQFWNDNLDKYNGDELVRPAHEIEVYSDAGEHGWRGAMAASG